MNAPTNQHRRERFRFALEQHADQCGNIIEEGDEQAALTDLLADLLHWADKHADFECALSTARIHFEHEKAEESEA